MASTQRRPRSEEIRRFILDNVEYHSTDIGKTTGEHFKITRQAVHKHLHRLISEKALIKEGNTRSRTYKLAVLAEWQKDYSISPDLAEDVVWRNDVLPALEPLSPNGLDIWRYGFTEMFNNAIEHSEGSLISVAIVKTAATSEIFIVDNGVGIFKKIQRAFNLLDERHAILELSKGKLTTDPSHHSGEGIFFTSRMFDSFVIDSGEIALTHQFDRPLDVLVDSKKQEGTLVSMVLSNHTSRRMEEIFNQFASGDEVPTFNRTVVPVALAQYGDDKLVSRSQAKRILTRVELFKKVVLDFKNVPTIGQGFADEMFRVFPREHPDLELFPINLNPDVRRMIMRARAGAIREEGANTEKSPGC